MPERVSLCALRPQENHELRKASIVLFGNLTRFSAGNCEDVFFEQILNGLVTLLLHLQDPKPEVIRVSVLLLDWLQRVVWLVSMSDGHASLWAGLG